MGINRKVTDRVRGIATLFNSATAEVTHIDANTNGVIFDKGRVYSSWDGPWYGRDYGEWLLIPHEDFDAQVKAWGAGGGSHGSTGGAAGGGGHASADITFVKDKPYVIWVGEGGFYNHHNYDSNGNRYRYRSGTSFGNGGGGGHNGGGGGGMSGVFFDAGPTNGGPGGGSGAVYTTFKSPGQTTALLIAGGGGGAGHHSGTYTSNGGGGGGATSNTGHAQGPSTQTGAGHYWDDQRDGANGWIFQGGFGGPSSYTGGGGGGWYGGPGGTQRDNAHHNGGSGGSGHVLDINLATRNPNYWIYEQYPTIVRNGNQETAPGSHSSTNPAAAATADPDYINYTGYGGGNSATFTPTTSSGNNGRVLVRLR